MTGDGDDKGAAVVDLPRVRVALAALDAAVAQGVQPVPGELVAALVAAEGEQMAAPATVALGVRLPAALLARVDAVAAAGARGNLPGWTRNGVLLAALEAGLPEVERQAGIDTPAAPAVDQGETTAELVAVLRRLLVKLDPPAKKAKTPKPEPIFCEDCCGSGREGYMDPAEEGEPVCLCQVCNGKGVLYPGDANYEAPAGDDAGFWPVPKPGEGGEP